VLHATTTPTSRKIPWAIVIVVLATMTDARLASSGACPRRSQALTASPPSAAGVVRLKASPASLEANRTRKPTSRRNAKRQPSVSNTATSTAGKHRMTASRQDRSAIDPTMAAGSFCATSTASSAAPSRRSATRR
jgi:hypothetical protein